MSKKSAENSALNKVGLDVAWRVAGVVIISLAICMGVVLIGAKVTENAERQKMAQYLRGKYGQEFMVEAVRREGAGLGVAGQLTANAGPATDKGLLFEVGRFSTGQFYDTYMRALWSREALKEASPLARNVLNNQEELATQVFPIDKKTQREDTTSTLYSLKPTLSDQLAKDAMAISLGLYVKIEGSLKDDNRTLYEDRVIALGEYINSKKVGDRHIRYVVNVEGDNSRYVCDRSSTAPGGEIEINDVSNCFVKYSGTE